MQRLAARHVMLRPVRITPDRSAHCFPLAWLAQPALTPGRWRTFVRGHAGGSRRGLMTIEDGRAHAHALYAYLVEHDLALMRLLRIKLYAVSTFPGLDVYGVLLHSFQAIAQQSACARVIIDFSECANKGTLSRDFIEQSGFQKLGGNFIRDI